jgi:hypothetical protein
MVDRVKQMWCGLHGHDSLLQFEQDRIFLRCVSCGHETPGWDLNEAPPIASVETEPAKAIVRPQLVGARRVA